MSRLRAQGTSTHIVWYRQSEQMGNARSGGQIAPTGPQPNPLHLLPLVYKHVSDSVWSRNLVRTPQQSNIVLPAGSVQLQFPWTQEFAFLVGFFLLAWLALQFKQHHKR